VIGDPRRLVRLRTIRLPGHDGPSVVAYLDDDTLVTAESDVRFWNPHTGRREHVLSHGADESVDSFDATADGRTLVVGYDSGDVVVWDVAGERARILRHAHNDFAVVALDPGGRVFASGGREGAIKLWDLASGAELGDPLTVSGEVQSLFFDSGRALAAMSESETTSKVTFRAWRSVLWRDDAAVAHLCTVAGRDLTTDEWRQFAPGHARSKTCLR
jgi:WD40 repeat protein